MAKNNGVIVTAYAYPCFHSLTSVGEKSYTAQGATENETKISLNLHMRMRILTITETLSF